MKKLFIAGLIMFLVFFALGSAIWFGVEAHGNQVKTIEKSYSKITSNELMFTLTVQMS